MTIEMMRRGMGDNSAPLPYDSQVEYLIPTDTTTYIDTGFIDDGTYTISVRGEALMKQGNNVFNFFYGAGTWTTKLRAMRFQSNGLVYIWYDNTETLVNKIYNTSFLIVDAPTLVTFNGASIKTRNQSSFSTESTIYLFRTNGVDNTGNAFIKISEFSIKKNDVFYRKMIPVRVKNVGYMYDYVTDTLYGNSGGGAFYLGPDVSNGGGHNCLIINILPFSVERRAA